MSTMTKKVLKNLGFFFLLTILNDCSYLQSWHVTAHYRFTSSV